MTEKPEEVGRVSDLTQKMLTRSFDCTHSQPPAILNGMHYISASLMDRYLYFIRLISCCSASVFVAGGYHAQPSGMTYVG